MSKIILECELSELDTISVTEAESYIILDINESSVSDEVYLDKEGATLLRDKLSEFINKKI